MSKVIRKEGKPYDVFVPKISEMTVLTGGVLLTLGTMTLLLVILARAV